MDTDIQFGEVEEESPRQNLRPDKNRHFAVAAYGTPMDAELPIFLDLDVARDLEAHALSDTTVELGGVLLGGQHEDDDGRPFVVVSDSLRAAHYESTKGSFKFTHDTWSAITREREQFPPELQMVGWYHTHPDWGVFLSGMDMFICDNFFNKKLDVAYVIDPCRGDRGMFQWTGNPRERVRRTGGFYITASRFRQAELEQYVAFLEGKNPAMPTSQTSGYGTPVIHVAAPPPPPAGQMLAVVGMLLVQACLLTLLVWKMLAAPPVRDDSAGQIAEKLDELIRTERVKERMETQNRVLDSVLANLKDTEPGFAARLEKQLDRSQDLALDVDTYRAQLAARKQADELTQSKLTALQRDLDDTKDLLGGRIKDLQEQRDLLSKEKAGARAELAVLQAKLNPQATAKAGEKPADAAPGSAYTWWIAGGSIAALVVVLGAAIVLRKTSSPEEEPKNPAMEPNT